VVADHVEWLKLTALGHLGQLLPVLLDGRLAVAFEHDAAFHEGADIEMVCLEGEKREMLVLGALKEEGEGEKEVEEGLGRKGVLSYIANIDTSGAAFPKALDRCDHLVY
jgi:hypothetical protein